MTDLAVGFDPAILCLVTSVRAGLANPNVLLHLTEDLALLIFVATLELGTVNHPVIRNLLSSDLAVPCVTLEPTDLADAFPRGINSQLHSPSGAIVLLRKI